MFSPSGLDCKPWQRPYAAARAPSSCCADLVATPGLAQILNDLCEDFLRHWLIKKVIFPNEFFDALWQAGDYWDLETSQFAQATYERQIDC
jgi:hypothetical protein